MSKLKRAWRWVAGEAALIGRWFNNLAFVFLTTKSKIKTFDGYGHYWFAQRYADRRTAMTAKNKVAGRKRHYVLPAGDYSLVVINRLEINWLKSRGIIGKNTNIVKLLEDAYYISK